MKRFAVIGLGNFGFHAAKALFEDGNEVVAIDTDKARVQAIDPYSTEAVVLDATLIATARIAKTAPTIRASKQYLGP